VPGDKSAVRAFWDQGPCGEIYATGSDRPQQLAAQARERYRLEPHIAEFAGFREAAGKKVLEVGVGMGADHLEFAKAGPRLLIGIDLTDRGVAITRERFELAGYTPNVHLGDAENLPFPSDFFDIVYSYGVLHHSPDTEKAVREVFRVLAPGGTARIMIYSKYSMVGYMLWLRYGLFTGKPWQSLKEIYRTRLESPGTQAFTIAEARKFFAGFKLISLRTPLGFGDLLQGQAGQRHGGVVLSLARRFYPRGLIKKMFANHGLGMMIVAVKPQV
jgi:ubiquinone/menaquinone biosynthesis C-methylase UbiE